jgi:hypothetical protein
VADEIATRRAIWWQPYHDALAEELERLRARHGHALLWDAHSIASVVPRFFAGRLADLNLGTADGASCAPPVQAAAEAVLRAQAQFSHAVNGRFKGGYITRHYGAPQRGVHALQMEMCHATYMDEAAPFTYRPELAGPRAAGATRAARGRGAGGGVADSRRSCRPVGPGARHPTGTGRRRARRDRAVARLQPERARGVAGHAEQRLGRREAEQRAGHVQHQRQVRGRAAARVAVGRDRHRHPMPAQQVDRRQLRVAQEVERARQQHRDAAGPRQRGAPSSSRCSRWSADRRRSRPPARRRAGSTAARRAA